MNYDPKNHAEPDDHDDDGDALTPDSFTTGDVFHVRYTELRQILRAMFALKCGLDIHVDLKANFTFTILEAEFNTIADMLTLPDSDAISDQLISDMERRAFTAPLQ